jgi:hypothetical protein
MYDHIKAAIDKGQCLLEWDGGPDHAPCPVPLLKDKFASERRKAKVRRCFMRGAGGGCGPAVTRELAIASSLGD